MMTYPPNEAIKVLLLTGPPSAGKSTVARYLRLKYSAYIKSFAFPLKSMICRGFEVERAWLEGPEKELPSEIFGGHSPRHVMQTLGTEWGRNLIHPDVWVTNTIRSIHQNESGIQLFPASFYVYDDARFGNEVALMQEAFTTRIIRLVPTYEGYQPIEASGHASETQELPWDVSIENSGDLEKLSADVEHAMKGIWL